MNRYHLHPMKLIWILLLLCVASSAGRAEQLLINPEFEQATGDKPAAWTAGDGVTSTTRGRVGSGVTLGKDGRLHQCFPLVAGYLYRGSVWARGQGKLALSFYEYKDGPGQGYVSSTGGEQVAVTADWQQIWLSYSQGANEGHLKGLCFAIAAVGENAEVVVDDASVEKTSLAPTQANLLRNPDFSDADGDGVPDSWRGEKRRLRIETGPNGIKVTRVSAALFSEDYQPEADFKDWWDWNRWGEQHGSGWPPLPRPLGGQYTVIFESDSVPVEPGRRYDAAMLLRHLDVWGEFIAVRWFNAEKKPTEEFEERIGYYHISDGHSSDWVRYVGRVTSPQSARFASVVVGCKQSSGVIWVAQPSLSEGLGAPNRHEPRSEWLPVDLKQGKPRGEVGHHQPRTIPPRRKPGVQVSDSALAIVFGNGLSVIMPLRGKNLIGITEVACGGCLLRNPTAPPLAPVVETAPRRSYAECRYESYEQTKDGVVVHSSLRTADGQADRLDWILSPVNQTLAGRRYQGLKYSYRFHSDTVRVRRIMDRATWEVGGTSQGLQVTGKLHAVGDSSTYCLTTGHRFVESDSFDYETCAGGTLVRYLDRYHTSLFSRAATSDFVILQDTFLFPEVSDATTTSNNVLFCAQPGGSDDWARIRDTLFARYRAQLGAPPEKPLEPAAMIIGYGGLRGIGDLRPADPNIKQVDYYRWVAEKAIPRLAQLGFKRVMMVLPRAPWNWPENDINNLGPDYEKPFKDLCDTARKQGIGMIAWYGSVQNLDGAAVWKEHPEYILKASGGQRARTYYSPWGWPGKLEAGFRDHTLERLKGIRRRTGLDGLWLDSYSSATHGMELADFGESVRQADGLLTWQAAIEKLGYYTYCEGSPHCIGYLSNSGWEQPEEWSRFQPETYYKEGLYLQQPWSRSSLPHQISEMGRFLADPEKRYYYRMLANRCCPILDMGHFGTDKDAMERIAQSNRDFNAVCDLMETRRLLGEKGVEWISAKGRAAFVFEPIEYAVPREITSVRDVTSGKNVTIPSNRRLRMDIYHTYKLTKAYRREGT